MKPTRRVLYALMLAVLSGVGACERSDGLGDLTGPKGPTVQQDLLGISLPILDGTSTAAKKQQDVSVITRTNVQSGDMTYTTSDPVTKWGAVLNFGGHKLVIPAGAVTNRTTFSATVRGGSEIRLDLRAWDDRGAVTNFNVPVQLTINLADAATTDLSGVSVFYLSPAGTVEKQPSVVNWSARTVTGYLTHFSDYIPGTLRNDPPPPIEP
jgi:hypothetical protein